MNKAMLDLKKWCFALKIALHMKSTILPQPTDTPGVPKAKNDDDKPIWWLRDAGASKILTGSIHLTVTEKRGFHLLYTPFPLLEIPKYTDRVLDLFIYFRFLIGIIRY